MDSRLTFRPRTEIVTNVVGTQKGRPTGGRLCRAKQVGGGARQIRCLDNPETRVRAEGHSSAKWFSPRCQEKLRRESSVRPYRKPTQVGRHNRAKAREGTLVKELGNLAP
jgi:hypothetical protein